MEGGREGERGGGEKGEGREKEPMTAVFSIVCFHQSRQ